MKAINTIVKIGAKILEVFHWVGTALMGAATVCALAAPHWVDKFISLEGKDCCGVTLDVYGFEVNAPMVNGTADMTAFFVFGIGATVILAVMALVFRNLNLIFKCAEKDTPFTAENIRRCRRIGFFSVAIPVIGFIMSIVFRLVVGPENAELSLDMGGVFMGLMILCITQYFVRGAALEKDVDGLV